MHKVDIDKVFTVWFKIKFVSIERSDIDDRINIKFTIRKDKKKWGESVVWSDQLSISIIEAKQFERFVILSGWGMPMRPSFRENPPPLPRGGGRGGRGAGGKAFHEINKQKLSGCQGEGWGQGKGGGASPLPSPASESEPNAAA